MKPNSFQIGVFMEHIYFTEFENLRDEYREPKTNEEKIIKSKLNAIVDVIENCVEGEGLFADEITLNFAYIIALIKNQHRKELLALTQKYEGLQARAGQPQTAYMPQTQAIAGEQFEYDRDILDAFYCHFAKEGQLPYWQIENYEFESDEERKRLVNLTLLDYCNRIKTFSKKYLFEIYPENVIPNVIHGESADEYGTYEPIVFIYNNLEMILAKFKIGEGKGAKQRLNIRSALRKLNDFKQDMEEK
jgi:hypothetical protein